MDRVSGASGSFSVRLARPSELTEAGRVTVQGYHTDGLLDRHGRRDLRYEKLLGDAAGRSADADVVVAVAPSGTVLGTVTWCPPGSAWRELAAAADQAEFRMLSVAPAGRRRGVAAALVQWCLDRAAAEQMREVVLSSLPEMTAAHRLYARFGFSRAPELDHTPVPGVDLWAFRLLRERLPASPGQTPASHRH